MSGEFSTRRVEASQTLEFCSTVEGVCRSILILIPTAFCLRRPTPHAFRAPEATEPGGQRPPLWPQESWQTILARLKVPLDTETSRTFCAVPRETRDRFVSLREGPGPKFRETRRVTPSDLLRVATERCRDGFGPTQCSLDGKWSFVADVTTASGGHARLQKGWARSTLLRHVACADDLDARADTAKKPALEPRAGTETQRGDIFSDPESIRKHVAPRRVPTIRISPADGRVLDGVAQREPALGNQEVNSRSSVYSTNTTCSRHRYDLC